MTKIAKPSEYSKLWMRLAALDRAFTFLSMRPLASDRTHEEFIQKLFEASDRIYNHLQTTPTPREK